MRTIIRVALTGFFVLIVALPAQAQGTDRAFSVQNFLLAPGHDNYLTVEGASVRDDLRLQLGGLASYQYSPLFLRDCDRVEGDKCTQWSNDRTALIKHHLTLDLIGAFSFNQIFEVAVALPINLYQSGDDLQPTAGNAGVESPRDTTGLGDLRLHLKLDLLHGVFGYEGDKFGLALVPVITFPTGNAVVADSFMGHSSVSVNPKLAFDVSFGRVRLGVNGGYMWREQQDFYLAEIGPRITYGVATEISITEQLSGVVEAFGSSGFDADLTSSPLEADAALRYRVTPTVTLLGGVGAAILAGVGTPLMRVFGGVVWSPAIGSDRDKDGIVDSDDECPDDPEDKDGFEDTDGCPDPDNDQDGLLDADDDCPDEAEDKDGYQDLDGCPEPDNDGDGIPDSEDSCPMIPEDPDGFEDEDGCPDPDNDSDGIPDVMDNCPTEKEVLNGIEDEDGCPDEGEELVFLEENQLKIHHKIHFKYDADEIEEQSYGVLNVIVTVLKTNPKMKLRIEGHTDAKGTPGYNRDLSERRTDSVKAYLVMKGIDGHRLETRHYGQERPIDTNDTKEGRAANRRVEFHIKKR